MEDRVLDTSEVDRLATLVEEATRATKEAPRRFIEPARGTLDRAKSKRHHLIFGRRGSGKTSLLRKALADLSRERIPAAFVDLEAFKGHSYPDVLLSVLIETFSAFRGWLESAGTQPANKVSWWKKLFGGKPSRPPLDKEKSASLQKQLTDQIDQLKHLLYSEDGADVTEKYTASRDESESAEAGFKLSTERVASASIAHASSSTSKATTEIVAETKKRKKVDFLLRHIIEYQKLFEELVGISPSDAYVFLDDLYHIRRPDQAEVLDYFHRIFKGRSVWLKVGTIRHRTDWYHHREPPIGMKLGDDADDIDLDITLEKYEIAKKFLLEILNQLIIEAGLEAHSSILVDGGVERLVLASGGVARDFLTIFRKAIDVAREREQSQKSDVGKIGAEDVNVAAGEHEPSKRDELKRDTIGERAQLEHALGQIQNVCVQRKVNCFLVERDQDTPGMRLLSELVDLRFVHLVASRITVRHRPGKLYSAYMLDISQYTGERKRRGLLMIRFWKRKELEKLRLPMHIFQPVELVSGKVDE